MKTEPVRPARIEFDEAGTPLAPEFGDVYHARAGADGQARHVFLAGNGLPARWAGREDFTILETGFGLGHNFIATWRAWRDDPRRCRRLHYVAIEKHPPTAAQLSDVHARLDAAGPADADVAALRRGLRERWPLSVPNLHAVDLDGGRVRLLLAFFDVRAVLPELVLSADAFYLDGFAPARNPAMWEPRVLKALGRLAAPGATAATWSVARGLRDGLVTAGFEVTTAPGYGGKREMTVARHAPRAGVRRPPARNAVARPAGPVAIIGGGLAGCLLAGALAELGIACRLHERHASPALEASGQAAGLYHGIVTPNDGPHARFNRAAALHAARTWAALDETVALPHGGGLLRLEDTHDAATMRSMLAALGLPPGYVQALDPADATARAGFAIGRPAWWYPQGGCTSAGAAARAALAVAGGAVDWRGGGAIAALRRSPGSDAGEPGWVLLDAAGTVVDIAATVVLCNAADVPRLAARLADVEPWPLERRRGQTSAIGIDRWQAASLPLPRCAIAGHGYLLPERDGRLLFGATSTAVGDDDDDATPRDADHRHNLARLASLLGPAAGTLDAALSADACEGRVGWRLGTDDRLPIVGGFVDPEAAARAGVRLDQPRLLPRAPGLWTLTALASRGLTWAPLAARTLAGLIAGTPVPLESSLLDAIDPGRFRSRAVRQASVPAQGSKR